MFKKEQIESKVDIVDKRTYNAPFVVVPTSLLINQTLARVQFRREKKIKFTPKIREIYQFR